MYNILDTKLTLLIQIYQILISLWAYMFYVLDTTYVTSVYTNHIVVSASNVTHVFYKNLDK